MSAAQHLKLKFARPRQSEADSTPHVSLQLGPSAVLRANFSRRSSVALNSGVTFSVVGRSNMRVEVRSRDAKLAAAARVLMRPTQSAPVQE